MVSDDVYAEELDYLVDYAHQSLVYFDIVRDAAEKVSGPGSTELQVQRSTLRIIADMIDRGVKVGDPSPQPDEELIEWVTPKGEVLNRISEEMAKRGDPSNFIDICWFRAGRPTG
jgi:hypothetical protein